MVARLVLAGLLTAFATSAGLSQAPPNAVVLKAATAVSEATRLREQKTADALRSSAAKFEEAISLFREAGDARGEADALIGLADVYQRLSDTRRSMEAFEHALVLFREQGNRKGEAAALTGIGAVHLRVNHYREAREMLNQSLPLYRALGDRSGEAAALQNLGSASFSQDEYRLAIDFYNQGLALSRAAGNRALEASIVFGIGQVYYHLGDYQKALDLYGDALAVHRAVLNRSGEAVALASLGRVYRSLGDYQKALEHQDQALTIFRTIGERMNEATALNNNAHTYLAMGEYRRALPLFEQSLEICRLAGNRAGEASNTNGIGLVHAGLQEPEKALPYHREALRLFRAIGQRRAEADSLGHIGRSHQALHEHQQALGYLNDALAIYRAVSVPREESETLYAIARSTRATGDLAAARSHIDAAIGLAEGFRQDISSQQLRTSYLASVRDLFELKIDVLMQLHQQRSAERSDATALEASERARARGLLDLLAEARADIRYGVDPSLLERERTLRRVLAARAERQTQLLIAKSAPDQLAAIAREIDAAVTDYQDVQTKIRHDSPQYAALMQPEPLTLGQIQTEVLDKDTLLLEYFLGAERSYLWAVTQDVIAAYQLPPRADVEALARRVYDLAKGHIDGDGLQESARKLSAVVLAPAADQLGKKRLAIVADGALHYVPFAALPEPTGAALAGNEQPLIVHHEVVSLPSASTLAVLRREGKNRVPAPNLVAVVADPVFDANDVRVRRNSPKPTPSAIEPAELSGLVRSVEDIGLGQGTWPLPRLLGTRREARAILSLAPAARSRQSLDFEASRDTATAGELGTYQVIHFATHALINNQHPELSGLVLSLVDRNGQARDGFLRLNDIYNLRLPGELVVLSACKTGLGQEIRGEGLIGLTRGFMYAGVPRLIASLWEVDDRATSELMQRFYQGMFGDAKLSAAAALRKAQIEMWRQKDWQSPYYWAAFGLQGEWQPAARR